MNYLLIILGAFGTSEFLMIVILALLLFGGKKIPELMRGLGTGLKEFKKATQTKDTPSNQQEEEKD